MLWDITLIILINIYNIIIIFGKLFLRHLFIIYTTIALNTVRFLSWIVIFLILRLIKIGTEITKIALFYCALLEFLNWGLFFLITTIWRSTFYSYIIICIGSFLHSYSILIVNYLWFFCCIYSWIISISFRRFIIDSIGFYRLIMLLSTAILIIILLNWLIVLLDLLLVIQVIVIIMNTIIYIVLTLRMYLLLSMYRVKFITEIVFYLIHILIYRILSMVRIYYFITLNLIIFNNLITIWFFRSCINILTIYILKF